MGTGTRTGFPGWGWGSPGCSSLIINTAQRTLSRPGGARGCARVVTEGVRLGLLRATGNPTPAPKRLNAHVGLKGHTDGEESSRSQLCLAYCPGAEQEEASSPAGSPQQERQEEQRQTDGTWKKWRLRRPPRGATALVGGDRGERAGLGEGQGRG